MVNKFLINSGKKKCVAYLQKDFLFKKKNITGLLDTLTKNQD
jgi:hypothetical protein